MRITPRSITLFTLFKLPAAFFTGVRVHDVSNDSCVVRVRLNWANKNPFRSMFWAVQGMAAELSTGVLIMQSLKMEDAKASMLVIESKATFSKKATGIITFTCSQGDEVLNIIQNAANVPQQIWLSASGVDEVGDEVCSFSFLWSIKTKN